MGKHLGGIAAEHLITKAQTCAKKPEHLSSCKFSKTRLVVTASRGIRRKRQFKNLSQTQLVGPDAMQVSYSIRPLDLFASFHFCTKPAGVTRIKMEPSFDSSKKHSVKVPCPRIA